MHTEKVCFRMRSLLQEDNSQQSASEYKCFSERME